MNNTTLLYILCEFISILFMFLYSYCKKHESNNNKIFKLSNIFFLISLTPFIILFFIRGDNVGKDYEQYKNIYIKINKYNIQPYKEWLGNYVYVVILFKFIFKMNYRMFFGILNSITLVFFYKAIVDNSKMPWLSLTVLFAFCIHLQIFNQFRQMMAVAICLYNYKNIKEKRLIRYMVLGLIACIMHSSAFIMLPMYFIARREISGLNITIYIIAALIISVGWDVIEKILSYTSYGNRYIGSIYDIQASSSKANTIIRIIMLMITLILSKNTIKKDKNNIILYNLVIICTLFQLVTLKSYIIARITTYFYVFYVLLIPEVCMHNFKDNSKKIVVLLLLIVLFSYKIIYYRATAKGMGIEKFYVRTSSFCEDKLNKCLRI